MDRHSHVLIGEQSLLIECGKSLLANGQSVRAVVSEDPAIRAWCAEHELRLVAPRADLVDALGSEPFDYLWSITNLRILPEAVIALPSRAALNFHDGPLPRYAGLRAPAWALLHGETEYGITFHEITAEVDAGDIWKQRRFEIATGETSLTLNAKCFENAIEAFDELIAEIAEDRVRPQAQDLAQRSYFGPRERPTGAAVIDPSASVDDVLALVRALDFGRYENPLARAKLAHAGRFVGVGRAEPADVAPAQPGTVARLDEQTILLHVAGGAVELGDFTALTGEALTVPAVAESLGLREGALLEAPDAEARELLTQCVAELTPNEAFWVRRLERRIAPDLPYLRPEVADGPFRISHVAVPPALAAEGSSGVAIAVVLYLARLSGRGRFDLAHPAASPTHPPAAALVADTVPLRVDLDLHAPLADARARLERELSRVAERGTHLIDVFGRFPALQGAPTSQALPVGLAIGEAMPEEGSLTFRVAPDGTEVELRARERAANEADLDRMRGQLEVLMTALVQGAAAAPRELPLLAPSERAVLVDEWNATSRDWPRERCIHELFSEQALRDPQREAVVFEEEAVSYRDLDLRANRLAHHLQALGVGPDALVGIHLERSIEMMVAVLAVMKAGGAYVPLDPTYPVERLSHMLEDSGARVLLTQASLSATLPLPEGDRVKIVRIDADSAEIAAQPDDAPSSEVTPAHLAYVIYTSGSTGLPKGVMVEHRNVVNFFTGMDARVEHDPPGVWLAVTSLSFDISVLELLFTLARGFKVVLYSDRLRAGAKTAVPTPSRPVEMSLFMWGANDDASGGKYQLMLEAARFGDRNGFTAIWTPERHFHAFGGVYPNPSVTGAAIAAVTERIQVRAGSCVLPLHHPIRVAEEWAVVDNLSRGRVGIAFAAGWQPNDFVIRPEAYEGVKEKLFDGIEDVRRLWRGEAIQALNPMGEEVPIRTLPRPVQEELPIWVTTAGNVDTYRRAGAIGANVLTHLLGQSVEEVGEKVRAYREARREAGLDPAAGKVTLMLHTFVGASDDEVREIVREPMKSYLRSSLSLVKDYAWAFPAFKRPAGAESPADVDLGALSEEEIDTVLEFAFERYFEESGLFGSPETCLRQIARVQAIDVDEIGCLIDYGVDTDIVLKSLDPLAEVYQQARNPVASAASLGVDLSFRAQVERHGVTHLQCTPSMAKMLLADEDSRTGLGRISNLMVGGEAFPVSLAHALEGVVGGTVTNMYGPTETTIWSATELVEGQPDTITVGRPIANTELYIVDEAMEPLPIGVPGELLIGGAGVVRGYHDREALTAERFVPDPFSGRDGARLYRTGDLARYREDGRVEFLGRLDHQVKIRGYRIELGEIEARLATHDGVHECVVVVRDADAGEPRLVAYLTSRGETPTPAELRSHLAEVLPEFMVPATFCVLPVLPLTPNGKIDRNALPEPEAAAPRRSAELAPPADDVQRTLAAVWQDVLKLDAVGIRDNFFDLGGHSLLVIQVHRALREKLEQPLSLTDLYRFPTIQALSDHLARDEDSGAAASGRDRAAKRKAALGRRRRPGRPGAP